MRIVAVNQFYAPDGAATAQLLTQLCEYLAAAGHRLTVVASRARYLQAGGYSAHDSIAGVEVVRPFSTRLGRGSLARRLTDDGSFWLSAVAAVARQAKPDVILVLTSPAMMASGAALVARSRGVPLVTWLHDLYPEVAIELGMLPRAAALLAPLRRLSAFALKASRRVVALSATMAERVVAAGVAPRRVEVIHNWADGAQIQPVAPAANRFVQRHRLEGRWVCMYSGTLGRSHDVDTTLAAAVQLRERCPRALFLFVGGGAQMARVRRLAARCDNVCWLPAQPAAELSHSLSAGALQLITLRATMAGLVVPSKLYGAMAAGRPLLFVGPPQSEVAQLIARHDLGWVVRPGDVQGLVAALLEAESTPALLAQRGALARRVFAAHYDKAVALEKWRTLLCDAAAARR